MKKIGPMRILLILLFCVSIATVYVSSAKPERPPFFDILLERGWRINVFNGNPWVGMGIPVPINEYTYVLHGWASDPWKDYTPEQKREFITTASFELWVDDEPINLRRYHWYANTEGNDDMQIIFWVEFKQYTFDVGFHTFEGRWYREVDGVPEVIDRSWDIFFVEPS
jgi:hypothetical protein